MKAIDTSRPRADAARPTERPFDTLRPWLTGRRVVVIAAIALAVGGFAGGNWLAAGSAYAQTQANPPQNQTVPQQGAGQGMMGTGQMMGRGGGGGMMGMPPEKQAPKDRGIIGIFPALNAETVGEPARLMVRGVAPYSPAYYAGIAGGDQIVAVDGQPVNGKGLSDVATAIRGEVGTPVKLTLSRQGQSREVSLTRVEPVSEHDGHHMSGHGHMGEGGMMDMMDH